MYRIVITVFFGLLLTQCSFLQDRRKRSDVEVKDLPRQARTGDEIRKRVIVLPFINVSPYPSETAADISRTTLISELHGSGEVVVLSVHDLPKGVEKHQVEDSYDIKKIVPMARKLGAHGIIVGRIKELRTKKIGDSVGVFRKIKAEAKTLVDLQMFSVKSGSSMVHEHRTANIQDEITRVAKYSYTDKELQDNPQLIRAVTTAAFRQMIQPVLRALRKLNWEGRVALVRGERIFLNAGRLSGIQVGDLLRITEGRDEVFDPETGSYIGKIRGRMKGTVEVVSYFGKDGSVTLIHSGSGFKENDIVEFY